MIFKKLLILLSTILAMNSKAMDYNSFLYKIEEGDNFSIMLKKFVKDESVINARTPMVKKIRKQNPQVKQWESLKQGTVVELYISNEFIDWDKYNAYAKKTSKKVEEKKASLPTPKYPFGFKSSIFYMSSLGMFNQKADNVAEISFKQNSPATLGVSFSFYPKESLYSSSFSAYYSSLMASANNLTADTISIPAEVGFTGYGEYRWQKHNLILYSGLDYESFSTFNLQGLQNDKKVYVDGVNALYLTFGVAKSFEMFKKQFFTKASVSKSVLTTYKNNAPASWKISLKTSH